MRFSRSIALAAMLASPLAVHSQITDSLRVGDRVRVRIAASRGTNVFIGDIASLSPDTLVMSIPGGKALITLPRLAISEVSLSDGRQSRLLTAAPHLVLLGIPTAMLATAGPFRGPHSSSLNSQRYMLLGLNALLVGRAISRTPPERWRPVYGWLDRR